MSAEFIGDAQLAPGQLLDRHLQDSLFDFRRHTMLPQRFLA
jgi:hypothetical protein